LIMLVPGKHLGWNPPIPHLRKDIATVAACISWAS
jgi:hypothetical protein